MADNQQFCLRWNNHQSTLVSVFDNLLEHGTLVDCTLAAEGQYLKAHKVVLCACSPYLELLLSQHYEKHPILILKDVKFQELKSMMDYMYKGEVNISQDQLGTFLKAAESLQIKGLTDGGGGENDSREVCSSQRRHDQQTRKTISSSSTRSNVLPSNSSGLTIEPSTSSGVRHNRSSIGQDRQPGSPIRSREDSLSPTPRKRRRQRRASQIDETFDSHHDSSNSSDLPSQGPSTPLSTIPSALSQLLPSGSSTISKAPDDPDQGIDDERLMAESGLIKEKMEPQSDLLEPKTEYIEEQNNDDSVEDLTLDDDDDMDGMEAGPSHGDGQGYGSWQMAGERATDEVFMAAQEAVGAHRDSQEEMMRYKSDMPSLKPLNLQSLASFGLINTNNINNTTSSVFSMAVSQRYYNKLNCLQTCSVNSVTSSSYDTYDSSCSDTSVVSGDPSSMNDNDKRQFRKHNRDKEPIFGCLDCGKRYRSKTSLSLHKRLECGKEPAFQCPFCPLKTHQKGNLQVHIRKKHSDPRNFVGHSMS